MHLIDFKEPRVLACQRGARRRYAVPRLLEESGLLTALYTDSTIYSMAGRVANILGRIGIKSAKMKALISRKPLGIPTEKIFCSDKLLHASLVKGLIADDLSEVYKKWGLQGANIVYSMCGEEFEFLKWAKRQGARIIIDTVIHPGSTRIMERESLAATGISREEDHPTATIEAHFVKSFKLADVILCPSEWVASGVREMAPDQVGKIRIVPYGSSIQLKEEINAVPTIGNILCAGRDPLRKGVRYLAEATAAVRAAGIEIDVRVAGLSSDDISWMEHASELQALGSLPMNQMQREFDRADVFVLPSLSEGQAGVLLEAMSRGCPVIATKESGVDLPPEAGITIPARDAQALAEAIKTVVTNREKRNALAKGALKRAADFSVPAWKQRLENVIRETAAGNIEPEKEEWGVLSKKAPGVSIYIIAHIVTEERGEILKTICENALAQNYEEFEVVVSDNAGPLLVENVLNSIEDSRLKIFRNDENLGFAGNFNQCLNRCAYDIIKFNCDDDLLHPDFLKTTVPYVDDDTFVVVDYEKYLIGTTPEKLGETVESASINRRHPGYASKFWKPAYISLPGCTLFTRTFFEELGGYSKASILPDWDLMVEARICKNVVHVKETLCWMGVWDDSITVKSLKKKPYFFQHGWLFTKFRVLKHEQFGFVERMKLRNELTRQFLWQSIRVLYYLHKKNFRINYASYAKTYFNYLFNPRLALEEYNAAKEW